MCYCFRNNLWAVRIPFNTFSKQCITPLRTIDYLHAAWVADRQVKVMLYETLAVSSLLTSLRTLKTNLEKLNFNEKEVKNITRKLQTISVSGTVKIMKTFMGFKM